jgi:hypothetical protein
MKWVKNREKVASTYSVYFVSKETNSIK